MNSQSMSTQDLAVSLAVMASQTRCRDVVVLDMRGRSPVTEFFVLATGTSDRQMRAVGDELGDHGAQCGFKLFRRSGDESANWILLDFVGVVAHIFNESSRAFYDLETLWDGCPRIDWQALAQSHDQAVTELNTRPTAVTMPTASVDAAVTPNAATSPANATQAPEADAPKASETGEIMEEAAIEVIAQVDEIPSPADLPEPRKPLTKRRSVAARPRKKAPVENKPRQTGPKSKKAVGKAGAKVPPAKSVARKTRRVSTDSSKPPKSRTKAATVSRPETTSPPRKAKRSAANKKPALRRKSR